MTVEDFDLMMKQQKLLKPGTYRVDDGTVVNGRGRWEANLRHENFHD